MGKKKIENKEVYNHQDLEDDVLVVDAFIHGEYKSMYLMDCWMKLKEHLLAEG